MLRSGEDTAYVRVCFAASAGGAVAAQRHGDERGRQRTPDGCVS